MTSIADILLPGHVNLQLVSKTFSDALRETLARLAGDPRIGDSEAFAQAVMERNAPAIVCHGHGIVIAHGRTNAVKSLIMAAGRSQSGLRSVDGASVRLIFVAGIPRTMDSEYLRIVGTLARLCRDPALFQSLLTVAEPMKFIEILTAQESKLS